MPSAAPALVEDISTYFTSSSRDENDKVNKIRENVIKLISNVPPAFLNDAQYGPMWITVRDAWIKALQYTAAELGIPPYTSIKTQMRGGRGYNYDADISYYNGDVVVGSAMIEFKNGGTNIDGLPQFLSLQAKAALFGGAETYDVFYYKNYLDKYLAVDSGLTEAKPNLDLYLNQVTKTAYGVSPWFAQLKARELINQSEKNAVVNASITEYLTCHGPSIDITAFAQKIRATQTGKIYLLWSNGSFYIDKLATDEMTGIVYKGIKNGNVLELQSGGGVIYGLLLRWRNHKGILNPAWQISMKRQRGNPIQNS